MSKKPFNPTGDVDDQDKAHTPDTLRHDVGRRKGHDMPEQDDTVVPEDYERPPADPTHGARGSRR